MRLSTCKQVWDQLYEAKKTQLKETVKKWLTDLSEENYQAFTTRAQQNPLHPASADDHDIDEVEEAALALYRQQSAENNQLIKVIQDARQEKAQIEAQQIFSGLPRDVKAALERHILNELFSQQGSPTFLPVLPLAPEATQS